MNVSSITCWTSHQGPNLKRFCTLKFKKHVRRGCNDSHTSVDSKKTETEMETNIERSGEATFITSWRREVLTDYSEQRVSYGALFEGRNETFGAVGVVGAEQGDD